MKICVVCGCKINYIKEAYYDINGAAVCCGCMPTACKVQPVNKEGNFMTQYEKLCEKLRALQNNSDIEDAHGKADDILCEALRELGYNELVELYGEIEKWYS